MVVNFIHYSITNFLTDSLALSQSSLFDRNFACKINGNNNFTIYIITLIFHDVPPTNTQRYKAQSSLLRLRSC